MHHFYRTSIEKYYKSIYIFLEENFYYNVLVELERDKLELEKH